MAKKKTKKKKTKSKTQSLVKREYTDEEKARLAKHKERARRTPVKFKKAKSDSGIPTVELRDPDDPLVEVKVYEALGTIDPDLQGHFLNQVVPTFSGTLSSHGTDCDNATASTNHTMAILNGIQPQDELEGMLAIQMIGVHNIAMRTMELAMIQDQGFESKQANVNQATKMLSTFMSQMEALKRYRAGGQQKMVVEHVHVNEGGQAIVGTINQGGGKNDKSCE